MQSEGWFCKQGGRWALKVLIVSGIFPPDVGGPATHTADLAEELKVRGHNVTLLTLGDAPRRQKSSGLIRYPRQWPWPIRHLAVASWIVRHRIDYEVVYAAGLHPAAVMGARLAGLPIVVKVAGDPVWERARRLGLTHRSFDEFQRTKGGGVPVRAMAGIRDWSLRRATAIMTPGEYLSRTIKGWIGQSTNVEVIPNGVRIGAMNKEAPRGSKRELKTVFVGRIVRLKRLDILLEALARCSGISLNVVGDGPARKELEQRANRLCVNDRVSFLGVLPHDEVLSEIAAADALLLASEHEGLPHVAIEALACGTPVVAANAGGIPEVITNEVNGLLLDNPSPEAFALALSRLQKEHSLRLRLSQQALIDGERWRFERCVARVESLLRQFVIGRPRAVFFGKGWFSGGSESELERKVEILCRYLSPTIVSIGPGVTRKGCARVVVLPVLRRGLLGGILFYGLGSVIALALAGKRGAVVCQSPYEGFAVLLVSRLLPRRRRRRVVVEVHGDWRTAPRLYGGRMRRAFAPFADRAAVWAVRRADRVRVVSNALSDLVWKTGSAAPIDRFIAFGGFEAFEEPPVVPLPTEPRVAFVGALEASKGPDVLIEAWPLLKKRIPHATLVLVGTGSMLQALQRQVEELGIDSCIELLGQVPRTEVRQVLDESSLLVLPSRSEGLGRVILEAFARARPVVATRVGGIPEVVEHGRNGLLVAPEDPELLADSIVELLENPERLRAMGEEGRRRALERNPNSEFEAGIARLTSWIETE